MTLFDQPASDLAIHVIEQIRLAGFETRFAGGCVRDHLLGLTPTDIDLATQATPQDIINTLDQGKVQIIPTGLSHGTLTVVKGPAHIEITTLRVDVTTDGRRAEVEFANDFAADAARRDFTINAMTMSPDGQLFDYFGGTTDLHNRVVRFVGRPVSRISEDYLRILRFFRFRARFGSPRPEECVLKDVGALRANLSMISGERIAREMLSLLSEPYAYRELRIMSEFGIDASIEFDFDSDFCSDGLFGKGARPASLIGLLTNGKTALQNLSNRWRLSKNNTRMALEMQELKLVEAVDLSQARRLIDAGYQRNVVQDLFKLNGGDGVANDIEEWDPPPFPLNGKTLIAAGIPAGPQLGYMIDQARDHWRNNGFSVKEAELVAWLRAKHWPES